MLLQTLISFCVALLEVTIFLVINFHMQINCSQTKFVAIMSCRSFFVIIRMADFLSEASGFSTSKKIKR